MSNPVQPDPSSDLTPEERVFLKLFVRTLVRLAQEMAAKEKRDDRTTDR